METAKFFEEALKHVEGPSVRQWATSANNRPILEKLSAPFAKKGEVLRFASYLVCVYLDGPA